MLLRGKPHRIWIARALAGIGAAAMLHGAVLAHATQAEGALAGLHPDYLQFVASIRPIQESGDEACSGLYMALVRPGAQDPTRRDSAPFAGLGARNDILYDPTVLQGGRSAGWLLLLLDHEYFHARHLAGATSISIPGHSPVEVEHHFFEAAAWGYNVAQARAGLYPGLTELEFREALDRYGEHYRALRDLTGEAAQARWGVLAEELRDPAALVRMTDPAPAAAPLHPSDSGR
jgi:hypothetical protein